jgi:hypothetical protein
LLKQLNLFWKLREMILYLFYHKKLDVNNLSERQQALLREAKHTIENDILYLDFASLVN